VGGRRNPLHNADGSAGWRLGSVTQSPPEVLAAHEVAGTCRRIRRRRWPCGGYALSKRRGTVCAGHPPACPLAGPREDACAAPRSGRRGWRPERGAAQVSGGQGQTSTAAQRRRAFCRIFSGKPADQAPEPVARPAGSVEDAGGPTELQRFVRPPRLRDSRPAAECFVDDLAGGVE
jgi:hypothetical protein